MLEAITQPCCGLNICAPSPISYIEILMLNVMVLGSGAIERYLDHEGRAFTNRISALVKGFY